MSCLLSVLLYIVSVYRLKSEYINSAAAFESALSNDILTPTILLLNNTSPLIIDSTIFLTIYSQLNVQCISSKNNLCKIQVSPSNTNNILFDLTLNASSATVQFSNIYFVSNKLIFNGNDAFNNEIFINSSIIDGIDSQIIHNSISTQLYLNNVDFTADPSNITQNQFDDDGGYIKAFGPLNIVDSSFKNTNIDGRGGIIYCDSCKQILVISSIFNNSESTDDGGIIYIAGSDINAVFDNCIFSDSYSGYDGGVLFVEATGNSTFSIKNCGFINSFADHYGGHIYITTVAFYIDNTWFHAGYAQQGGCLCNKYNDGYVTNTNFTFCDAGNDVNGGKGGAVRTFSTSISNPNLNTASPDDLHSWYMDNVYFINNTCDSIGGALFVKLYGDPCHFNNVYFYNNTALLTGGAAHLQAGIAYFNNSVFENNKATFGGTFILIEEHKLYLTESSIAYNQANEGGGIYTTYGTYHLYDVKCLNNTAILSGGCIFDNNPIFNTSLHSTVVNSILSNNTAIISGAAIHFNGGANLNVSSTIFSHNIVYGGIGGGGVYVTDYAHYFGENNIYSFNYALQGGGMRILSTSYIWLSNETFLSNYGKNGGGGISGVKDYDTANNVYIYSSIFQSNYGKIGGAIYMEDISNFNNLDWNLFVKDSIFNNNSNSAIFAVNSNINLSDYNIFNSNKNDINGGAIFVNNGEINDSHSIFKNNTAGNCGGSIAMTDSDCLIIESSKFINNYANISGGAICINLCPKESVLESTRNVTFISNKARESGAAIQFESDIETMCKFCTECYFENNMVYGASAHGKESSFGSIHSSWKLTSFNIYNNGKIDNSMNLEITSQLYDSYNQRITYIPHPIIFEVDINNQSNLFFVTGTQSHSFNNSGYSLLKFKIEKYNVMRNDADKNWNIFLSFTASNIYTQTYSLSYSLNFTSISNVFFAISTFLFIATLIAILSTFAAMYHFRKTNIIIRSNMYLMFIILFGLFILLLALYLLTVNVNSMSCILSFILLHFGVLCVIGALGAKTLVLYQVFNNTNLQKLKRVSPGWLIFKWIVCPGIVVVIYLIFWIIFDLIANNFNSVIVEYLNGSYQAMCYFDNTFIYITLSMIIGPLFCLCLLSYESRKLPKDFNETFWIGASLYSVAIMVILSVPIMVNENIQHLLKMQLVFIAGIICINCILMFLFWLKIYRAMVNYQQRVVSQTNTANSANSGNSDNSTNTVELEMSI